MQTRSSPSAWYALGVLTVTTLYALIDREILVLLIQPIKADLHLSDGQIGSLLGLGSVLFAALATIPLGWVADKVDRRFLLVGCVLFWTAAVACCGLSFNFWSLLLCVSLLGVGEAGLSPVVSSMIPDLFSDRQRLTANFIYYAALVLGAGIGFVISGLVVDRIGAVAQWLPGGVSRLAPWRLAFFAVALPGPLFALAIAVIRLKKPAQAEPRPSAEQKPLSAQDRLEFRRYLATHWRAVFGAFGAFGLALLGASAVFSWLPITLTRKFGLSAGEIGAGVGVAIALGSVAGLVLAGVSANLLKAKWGDVITIRLPQIGYVVFALLSPLYLVASSATQVFVIAGVQMTANIAGASLSPTVYQNLAPARLRGRVFAFAAVIATLIQTASPVLVGLLSGHVFTKPGGLLLSSVAVGAPCMLIAAALMRLAEKHVMAAAEEVKALEAA